MEGREKFDVTPLTKVKRLPKRAVYDKEQVYAILDEAFVCHVGFSVDGRPFVLPTGFGRRGEWLYLHGKSSSHMIKHIAQGHPICITVTLLDGIVVARSLFHSSMNYRSVVIFGKAEEITDPEEKTEAMKILSNHIIPDRWENARLPTPAEIKGTKNWLLNASAADEQMVKLHLEEVSAKVRVGPPSDDDADLATDFWSGVIPVTTQYGVPEADPTLKPDIPAPPNVAAYRRPTPSEQ